MRLSSPSGRRYGVHSLLKAACMLYVVIFCIEIEIEIRLKIELRSSFSQICLKSKKRDGLYVFRNGTGLNVDCPKSSSLIFSSCVMNFHYPNSRSHNKHIDGSV